MCEKFVGLRRLQENDDIGLTVWGKKMYLQVLLLEIVPSLGLNIAFYMNNMA